MIWFAFWIGCAVGFTIGMLVFAMLEIDKNG